MALPMYDKFASEVSWQRVDPVTGSEVENSEDVTEPSGGGDNGGGGDDPGNMEG